MWPTVQATSWKKLLRLEREGNAHGANNSAGTGQREKEEEEEKEKEREVEEERKKKVKRRGEWRKGKLSRVWRHLHGSKEVLKGRGLNLACENSF